MHSPFLEDDSPMAKMFYTLDEVCTRLGKSQSDVETMVTAGEIQEFRDGETLVFKVEQIDLLASSADSGSEIELDLSSSAFDMGDSGGIDMSASGSAELDLGEVDSISGLDSPAGDAGGLDAPTPLPDKAPASVEDSTAGEDGLGMNLDGSSLSSFDLGGTGSAGGMDFTEPGSLVDEMDLSAELAAPAADDSGDISSLDLGEAGETRIGEGIDDLTLESVGSGSGLLDLTRESDDTSLGAELLEEVYSSDDDFVDVPAASGLFEAAEASGAAEAVMGSSEPGLAAVAAPIAGVSVAAQSWDPSGSGLSTGLCIGALVCLLGVFAIVGVEAIGSTSGLAPVIGEKLWIWSAGIAGGTVLLGLIGLLIGKKSG
jgi:hypothetical protein